MSITRYNSLLFSLFLGLLLAFAGCAPNRYTTPTTPLEQFIWTESNAILKNVAKSCNETNKQRLEGIKIYLNRKSFEVRANFSRNKIFVPAQGNLTRFQKSSQKSYLKDRCPDDEDCQVNLIKLYSIHHLLHELYHVINKEKYVSYKKNPEVFAKKPKGSRKKMSFAEEIKAESVVAKYLSIYDPALLATYKEFITKFLEERKFPLDAALAEQQWNTFAYKDYRETNNAQLFFFLHACEQLDGRSLEELLFEKF